MTFKTRRYECPSCGSSVQDLRWDTDPVPQCSHGPMIETGLTTTLGRHRGVIDDQIEGGPRLFETFGDTPVWVESKSQWRREVERHQVVNVDRHDSDYYAKQRKMHQERLKDTGSPYEGERTA